MKIVGLYPRSLPSSIPLSMKASSAGLAVRSVPIRVAYSNGLRDAIPGGRFQTAASAPSKVMLTSVSSVCLIQTLPTDAYRDHEAREVALRQFILLPTEPTADDDELEEELREKERWYQAHLPPEVIPPEEP
jgi:hypothetical protein